MKTIRALAILLGMFIMNVSLHAGDAIPIYHYYNGSLHDHFYTADWNELGNGAYGWSYSDSKFQISDNSSNTPTTNVGKAAWYEYYNGSRHFYTTNYSRLGGGYAGWVYHEIIGYMYTGSSASATYGGNTISTSMIQRYINSGWGTYYSTNLNYGIPSGFVLDNSVYSPDEGHAFSIDMTGSKPFSGFAED